MARAMPEYRRLAQDSDQDCADLTVATIWGFETRMTPHNLTQITTNPAKEQSLKVQLAGRLTMERNNIRRSITHLNKLLIKAYTNTVVHLLTNPGNQISPSQYSAQASDSDITKAAKWICSSSNTYGMTVNRSDVTAIERAIANILNRGYDLRRVETLELIHKAVVGSIPANRTALRATPMGQNYCGIGGGSYLQAFAAHQSRRIKETLPLPPTLSNLRQRFYPATDSRYFLYVPERQRHHNNWGNIACYLLGAHLRAHAFADGNGRASRTLFACAMLKSNFAFVAPTYAFEKELSGL
ncbi:hypothetical protein [Roseibium denhamense]